MPREKEDQDKGGGDRGGGNKSEKGPASAGEETKEKSEEDNIIPVDQKCLSLQQAFLFYLRSP